MGSNRDFENIVNVSDCVWPIIVMTKRIIHTFFLKCPAKVE